MRTLGIIIVIALVLVFCSSVLKLSPATIGNTLGEGVGNILRVLGGFFGGLGKATTGVG